MEHRADAFQRVGPIRVRAIAVTLACGFLMAGASAQEQSRFTFQQAIDYASANQPTIGIAEQAVRAAEAEVANSRARFFPSVTVSGSYTYNGVLPKQVLDFGDGGVPFPVGDGPADGDTAADPIEIEFGTRDDYRVIGEVQQPLFTWGKTRNGYRQAQHSLAAARHSLDFARQLTTLRTTEAFYGVVLAEEAATVGARAQEQAQRRLQISQSRLDAGVATRLDLLQAQVALANADTQLIRARNGVRLSKRRLVRVLGLDADTSVDVAGSLTPTAFDGDMEELTRTAINSRADRKELLAREAGARSLVSIARAGNKPNAALTGTAMWNDTEKQAAQTTWSIRLGVQFPIFDGFATRAHVRQATAVRRQAKMGIEALDAAIALEVQSAHLRLIEANAVLAAQEKARSQSDEALRIANVSFESGVITSVELADAELARTHTQLSHVQALHDSVIAFARLEQAVGASLR